MRCDKGHKMSTIIGVGIWQAECECGKFQVSLSGKNCSLRLTPLALDGVEVCPICERVHSCFSPCGDCLATRPASKA